MTVHSSKGLGYDDVIIVNGRNETYGFPSKIEDDPVLSFVIRGDRSIDYAEERRLFYVAMTRTKNRVFFIAPEKNPSEFLLELKHDYKNVVLRGNWNEGEVTGMDKKVCPLCGYPMQLKYKKAYGLRLYICSNEPEICGFMTNDIRGGKMAIQKCDECRDGYLIVKAGRDRSFLLGCTNYKSDGTGCNKTVNKRYYYDKMGYKMESDVSVKQNNNEKVDNVSQQFDSCKINITKEDDCVKIQKAEMPEILYKKWNLNDVIYNILNALQNISFIRYYGMTMLVDVLHGAENKRIFDNKLNKLPEFGIYRGMSRESIQSIVEWMLGEHYILKTKGRYPVLHSTYEGLHYSESITKDKLIELKKYLEEEILLWR